MKHVEKNHISVGEVVVVEIRKSISFKASITLDGNVVGEVLWHDQKLEYNPPHIRDLADRATMDCTVFIAVARRRRSYTFKKIYDTHILAIKDDLPGIVFVSKRMRSQELQEVLALNSPLRMQNQSLHFLNDFPVNAAYAIYENAYLDKLNVV